VAGACAWWRPSPRHAGSPASSPTSGCPWSRRAPRRRASRVGRPQTRAEHRPTGPQPAASPPACARRPPGAPARGALRRWLGPGSHLPTPGPPRYLRHWQLGGGNAGTTDTGRYVKSPPHTAYAPATQSGLRTSYRRYGQPSGATKPPKRNHDASSVAKD
jgi:hypothetical protein